MDLLAELEKALVTHDWWFDYSDDHRAWCRGRDQEARISGLMARARGEGLADQAKALMIKFCPFPLVETA